MGGASSTVVAVSPKQPIQVSNPDLTTSNTRAEPTATTLVPAKGRAGSQAGTPGTHAGSPKNTPPKVLSSSPKATGKKGVERLIKELQTIITSPQYTTSGYTVKTVLLTPS